MPLAIKESTENAGKPPPVCKAILLCHSVIIDSLTGLASAINVFDAFNFDEFPADTGPFDVFLQLADGIGTCRIAVEVNDLRDDSLIARADIVELVFHDRPSNKQLVIAVQSLPLAQEGAYDYVVLADGREIARQRFVARMVEGQGNATEEA